jgi:UDP-N-acetyl-D-mannosaminuronate dehydrogenase
MINDRTPYYCIEFVCKILNKYGNAMNNSKVLILGVSNKQNIDVLGKV